MIKINKKYIWNAVVKPDKYEDIQILVCSTFDSLNIIFNSGEFEKLKRILIVVIEKPVENNIFLNNIDENIPRDRPILIQSGTGFESKFYIRSKNRSCLEEELKIPENYDLTNFDTKNLIRAANKSLISLDLTQILGRDEVYLAFLYSLKAKDELCYRILKTFDTQLNDDENEEILKHVIETNDIQLFLAHLNVFNESCLKPKIITQIFSSSVDWKKMFLLSVEAKNIQLLKILTKHHNKHLTLKEALYTSIDIGLNEFIQILKNIKIQLPDLKQNIKSVVEMIENLHSNISCGNFEEVKNIVESNNKLRYGYGFKSKGALEHAIDCKQFHIYSFLWYKKFIALKEHENRLDTAINQLIPHEKDLIRKEKLKYVKECPDRFIHVILTMCHFDAHSEINSKDVYDMLMILKEKPETSPVLMLTSNLNLNIVLNYKYISVKTMDPNFSDSTTGACIKEENLLYLGKNYNTHYRRGTFIHELMHFVLYHMYQNNGKPYSKKDTDRSQEFKALVNELYEEYKTNKEDMDEILQWVFGNYGPEKYTESEYEAEVAVRVCHIVGTYLQKEKIERLKIRYEKLFAYHNKILADIQDLLNIANLNQIIKLNEEFGIVSKINNSKLKIKPEISFEIHNNKNITILNSNIPQLTLSMIYNNFIANSKNPLLASCKNIFIDPQKYKPDNFFEFFGSSKEVPFERVIFDYTNHQNYNSSLLNELSQKVNVIIITDSKHKILMDSYFKKFEISVNHTWTQLDKNTKTFLKEKKINYQGKDVEVSKVLTIDDILPDDILEILCKENITVNCKSFNDLFNSFDRLILKKNINFSKIEEAEVNNFGQEDPDVEISVDTEFLYQEMLLKDFLISTKDDRIVLISDVAGSGKTTILKMIYKTLVEDETYNYICFISLKDIVETLKNEVNSFDEFILKSLNFNKLEAAIFKEKYTKGTVKILFDGFDEISPTYKKSALKIFELFQAQEKNQIFVTTRTHLEVDLETKLNTLGHKLKCLEESEISSFFCRFWNQAHSDKALVQDCANQLTQNLFEVFSPIRGVIGLPLIVQNLASLYVNKLSVDFINEICSELKIHKIFHNIVIKANLYTYSKKKYNDYLMNCGDFMPVHRCLAITYLLGEAMAKKLGLFYNKKRWVPEEICRFGIIISCNEKIKFYHDTFAEYLLAEYIFDIIQNCDCPFDVQLEFLITFLTHKNLTVSRIFVDDMLNEEDNLEILKSSVDIQSKVIKEDFQKFYVLGQNSLPNLVKLTLSILDSDGKLYKSFLEFKNKTNRTLLMQLLPRLQDRKYVASSLEKILSLYNGEDLKNFFLTTDNWGNTIFHYFCSYSKCFDIFWEKITLLGFDFEFSKRILKLKNDKGNIPLYSLIVHKNEDYCYLLDNIYFRSLNYEDIIYEEDTLGRNLLVYLAKFGCNEMINHTLTKLKTCMDKPDFGKILRSRWKNLHILNFFFVKLNLNHKNIFKFYEYAFSRADLRCILKELQDPNNKVNIFTHNITKEEKLKREHEQVSENSENSPTESKSLLPLVTRFLNYQHYGSVIPFLQILKDYFNKEEMFKLITVDTNIVSRLIKAYPNKIIKETCEETSKKSVFQIIESIIGKSNFRKFLLLKDETDKNALFDSVSVSTEVFSSSWKIFCEFLQQVDLVKMRKKDFNLLQYIASYGTTDMMKLAIEYFENDNLITLIESYVLSNCIGNKKIDLLSVCDALEKKINNEEKFKYILISQKGGKYLKKRNLLALAIVNNQFEVAKNLWLKYEKIFNKTELLAIAKQEDASNNNLLHIAANQIVSVEEFKWIFEKIINLIFDDDERKSFLLSKGNYEQNILFRSVARKALFNHIFTNIYCKYFELKDFIFEVDETGKTILHSLAYFCDELIIDLVIKKLRNPKVGLSNEDYNRLLRTKSKFELNLLHFVALNKDKKSVEYVFKQIQFEVGDKNFKQMLQEKQISELLPLHCAIKESTVEVLDYVLSVYKKLFDQNEIKSFLVQQLFKKQKTILFDNLIDFAKSENKDEAMQNRVKVILKLYEVEEES